MFKSLVRKAAFVASFAVMVTVIVLIAPTPKTPEPSVPHCATLEAQALVSPNAVVAGSSACFTSDFAQTYSLTSDEAIRVIAAQPPVFTSYHYLGHTESGYYFQFDEGQVAAACFRFHIDASGHVDDVATKQNSCPVPLP